MTELHFQTVGEWIRALRERSLRSIDLVDHQINRIERIDGSINAVVAKNYDSAREKARAADAELDRGNIGQPLLGLPMTVKDCMETEGLVTTSGAPELADHVPTEDADAVASVVAAGAIVLGKTNLPLYAGDGQTYNEVYGTTNNPWDLSRSPGGSSGGAAAALASGMTPLEIGSDIGGSIRTPAHFCGVFGHKPTWGIVSDRGHIPGPPGRLGPIDLGVLGPMARSAEDLALALDVLAGPAPHGSAQGWGLHLPPARARNLADLRIAAWLDDPFSPVEHEVYGMLQTCSEALEKAGAHIDRHARPELDFAQSFENYAMLLHPIITGGGPPELLEQFREAERSLDSTDKSHQALQIRGALIEHRDWLVHNEIRHQLLASWRRFFRRYDIMLMPVHPSAALPHDHSPNLAERTMVVNGEERPYLDFLHWNHFASAAGMPATVAPIGRTAGGLPVGIQIVAAPYEDYAAIETARIIADTTGGFVPPPESD